MVHLGYVEQYRGLFILRHSSHGLPKPGFSHEKLKSRHHGKADSQGQQIFDLKGGPQKLKSGKGKNGRYRFGACAEKHHGKVFQEYAHSQSRNQSRHASRIPHRLIGHGFHNDAYRHTDSDGNKHSHPGRHSRRYHQGNRVKQCIAAHHNEITVSEIDHTDDTVNHCIPQSDQGIDGSLIQSIYQTL